LRAFEGGTDVPTKPTKPTLQKVDLGFKPKDIDKAKWQELRATYDLSGLPPYPAQTKTVQLVNRETRSSLFAKYDLTATETAGRWWGASYEVAVDADGYEIAKVMPTGNLIFRGPSSPADETKKDYYTFLLGGSRVISTTEDADGFVFLQSPRDDYSLGTPIPVNGDPLVLTLEAQNLNDFALAFAVQLKLSADGLINWQTQIYNAVRAKEQELVDAENREALIQYQSDLGDYHRALKELAGTAVNAVLQGESSAANQRVVDRELRRHCLAELSREFDEDTSDDTVRALETVGEWDVGISFEKMKVHESMVDGEDVTTFGWEPEPHKAHYPATRLSAARKKGNLVQFLEQAFDWDNLSYLFYPYFWATPPKWIELMNRADDADPFYTAFLQAGSARVLVSVTPGYEQAVLHYLATGQPWDGGTAPAIGDPLFVAVYQELRNEQDNLAGATPEGEPWPFVLPTSLTYLDGGDPLPTFPAAPGG
jgi:hypothetical protein